MSAASTRPSATDRGRPLDLALWSVGDLAAAVRRRELSPVEIVERAARRIEEMQGVCNAFVDIHADAALRDAELAERDVARRRSLGVLHGVPMAIKDLSDTRMGWRHTRGSRALAGRIAASDSPAVERLRAAGAILLGTTNTAELGHKCLTDNRLVGPTSTPFAPGLNAGGSSGGSAAAVAAGMVAAATGSDGAGSLRVPASYCGVFTLKPTFGRIPIRTRPNGFNAAWPMAHVGVLTRGVGDAATLMDVLAGPDRHDPLSQPAPAASFAAQLRGVDLRGLRVGYCPDWGGFPIAAEVVEAIGPLLEDLRRMGADVEIVDRPHEVPYEQLSALVGRAIGLMLADLLASQLDVDARRQVEADVLRLAEAVGSLSALEARRDEHLRTAVFDGVQAQLERHDVLVGPAVGAGAVANARDGGTVGPSEIDGRRVDPLLGWCPAFLFNLTGHPAACVPAGIGADGVPVGLQVVADRHRDAYLLAVCSAIERERPWADAYALL